MDKTLLVTLLLLGAASFMLYNMDNSKSEVYSFEQYKADYQKSYLKEGEEEYRKAIFLRNLIKIEEHNANPKNTHTLGINQFTDLTNAEFQALYLTLQVPNKDIEIVDEVQGGNLNGDIDWQAAGKVSAVKNQGSCGSCWAFSAIAALESAYRISEISSSVLLSEQDLVDCSRPQGNQGCNGGWMDQAFEYIISNGIATQDQYPYTARDGACKSVTREWKLSSYTDVVGCDALLNALAARPVSVAVDASVWSAYRSGVLSSCGTAVNHGVLLIGATDGYWRIKNSWGSGWGESGFIRLARGNTCAVCSYPSYPVV